MLLDEEHFNQIAPKSKMFRAAGTPLGIWNLHSRCSARPPGVPDRAFDQGPAGGEGSHRLSLGNLGTPVLPCYEGGLAPSPGASLSGITDFQKLQC